MPQIFLLLDIRGNADLPLGFAIPGIQVRILDRPIHELDRTIDLHLEIVRHKPQASAEPMRRASGDAIVGAGERPRALLNQIGSVSGRSSHRNLPLGLRLSTVGRPAFTLFGSLRPFGADKISGV